MLKVYNTQSHIKEELKTVNPDEVRMYVCGPTVYNYIHIGNARTFISFDIIRRYLIWRGYRVTFVQNVTDVDDKIIARANEDGRTAADVAAEFTKVFVDDMHAAGVMDPDVRPKATEEIDEMVALVQRLVDTGHAYEAAGDVYFSVRSFPAYGKLSHRNIDEMESGHRDLRAAAIGGIDERKRDPLDFALWKASKPGEPSWKSPWGMGRPGWHIECSAMSKKYLGLPFDIHGGGADLIFPHHENEVAQSEAAYGMGFANYWIHSGMLQINAEKMSKSLGNFLLLRDVLKTTRADVLRMLMAQTHYRSPLDFSEERLKEAEAALDRIIGLERRLRWAMDHAQDGDAALDASAIRAAIDGARADFTEAMDDDFNTAGALGVVFSYVAEVNSLVGDKVVAAPDVAALQAARDALVDLMGVFGIALDAEGAAADYPREVIDLARELAGFDDNDAAAAMNALLEARAQARKERNFDLADQVRDGLVDLGFVIEDTSQGARITYVAK